MRTDTISRMFAVVAALALAGCNGPTETGLRERELANKNFDQFTGQVVYDQAEQQLMAGQLDQAVKSIEKALALMPESDRCHLLKGRILLELNGLDQALASFETAAAKNPALPEAHYFAGIIHQRWTQDEEALAAYTLAMEKAPDTVQYLLASAEALIALDRIDESEALIESKLSYFEHNAALRQLLGQISMLRDDPRMAAERFTEARLLDPENVSLVEDLAWAQYEAGLYGQCLQNTNVIQSMVDEERLDMRHLEARCLTVLGRLKESHRVYLELTRREASDPSVWIEFGLLTWDLGDYRRVVECSTRAIALAPDRFEGWMLKGLYERHQGRTSEAVENMRRASELASANALPHLILGRTLEEYGQRADALEAYVAALQAEPESVEARLVHDRLAKSMHVATAEE